MSQHFGKKLCKVPYSYLRVDMRVIDVDVGAGTIILLKDRKGDQDDNSIVIQWDDAGLKTTLYHNQASCVIFAHNEFKVDRKPSTEDSATVCHTYGGFRGGFYVMNERAPTEQEIFDAGMRSGRDIQWAEKHAVLGHLTPEGLSPEQKVVALAGTVRMALLALKRIKEGHENPSNYAELTIKHLDTPSSKYLLSNELSIKDMQELMDSIVAKNTSGVFPIEVPIYLSVSLTELEEYTQEVLKRSKV